MFILKALIFNTLNNFTLKNSVHDTEWMQAAATGKEGWETGTVSGQEARRLRVTR